VPSSADASWPQLGSASIAKARLHFVPEKVKIKAGYYANNLLPALLEDFREQVGDDLILQQDDRPLRQSKHRISC